MKKLLAILASVTLVSSSSAAVVSCTSDEIVSHAASNYINNNFNNILAASLEKAKGVILNNEYGIDQSLVLHDQSLRNALSDVKGLDTSEIGKDATVQDLVTKYYGSAQYTNNNIKSSANIDLSGTNGVDSGLDVLLKKVFSALKLKPIISNTLLKGKETIIDLLQAFEKTVDSTNLNLLNHSIYNTAISGSEFLINTGLTVGINALNGKIDGEKNDDGTENTSGIFHKIGQIINTVIDNKNTFAETTLPNFFTSDTMKLIKQVMSDIFDKNNANGNIQDVIYQNKVFTLPNFSYKKSSDDKSNNKKQLADAKDDNATIVSYSLSGASQIKDIKFVDIKKEFLASADRIVNSVLDWHGMNSDFENAIEVDTVKANTDLSNKLSWLISQLISNKGFKVLTKSINQQAIQGFVVEGLRLITIMNAQFSMLEDTMDITPKDTKHLFSNDLTNYQFLNNQDSKKGFLTKTLGDSPYVKTPDKNGEGKSEPINLNYFISNLNYYLGGLDKKVDGGTYRIQKFLFLVMNDPCDIQSMNPNDDDVWVNKQSDILDFIVNLGLNVAKNMFKDKTDDTSKKVSDALNSLSDADIETLKNMIVKPLFLGLLNGNSMRALIETAITGFDYAADNIPKLKTIFDGLKAYGINIEDIKVALNRLKDNIKFKDDTFHSLFTEDFRSVLKALPFIPQKYVDEFFGPDQPVNLTTFANFPLFKILAMLKIPGFVGGKIPQIGDVFTTQTIPQLLNLLNTVLNKNLVDGYKNTPTKYAVMKKDKDGKDTTEVDYENSLKAYDINLQAIYDLFISIVGDGNEDRNKPYDPKADTPGKNNNILSKLLKDLIKTPKVDTTTDKNDKKVYPYKVKPGIQLDPATAVTDLGFAGQVSKKKSDNQNNIQLDDAVPTIADGTTTDNKVFTFKTTNIPDAEDIKENVTIDKLPDGNDIASASVKDNVLTITLNNPIEQTDAEQDFNLTYKVDDKNSINAKLVVAAKAAPVKVNITNVAYDGSTSITADTTGIKDGDITKQISITSGLFGGDAQISKAEVSGGKLTITLSQAITNKTENDKVETITYKGDDGQSTTATFTVKGAFVGGTDLQFTPQSVVGAFSRLILPEIDANKYDDGDATYTVHDSYFNVDLLSHAYQNFVNLILDLDHPANYGFFIKQILDTQQAFEINYDPETIKYFQSDRNLIKGFTFVVTYKNYTVGQTNKYQFTVSRSSNIEGFKINSLITDKHN